MSGKKPSTVQGFIVTREFRGVALYLTSIHLGKGMRWLADRAKAMVISDAQDALAVSERASREWGTKAFVATTDEAPHIVERSETWQFNWRGYCAVRIAAGSEEEAKHIAIAKRPAHVPPTTELMHFGRVQS